ncbi:MAG TPA: 5-(carboxyamino)imidazole ribonucleotide synthase, partial [Acidimicrobiaceae bacterium]|nr:5-(carboxyamino)imidazole ribonucleotide synthase [Acidimicrobiaceae bacterium]
MLFEASDRSSDRMPPRIGMVGGGQLARMTAVAASRLGLSISVMDPELDCPASSVAQVVIGDPLDVDALV